MARTSTEEDKHAGLTMFSVPTDAPGLTIHSIDITGGREVNDLYSTDCILPNNAVIVTKGNGWGQLMAGLNLERMILASVMLGTARRTFDNAVDYVRNRKQFGRPVSSFPAL